MSAEPPSPGRPTGPPPGPLSGPSQSGGPTPPPPPGGPTGSSPSGGAAGPPSGPGGPGPGGGGPAGSHEGPGRPWWRSVPRIATIAVALVAAVVLAVVLTRPGGGSGASGGGGGSEVFLQAAGSTGPDPFTESTAKESSPPASTPAAEPDGAGTASPNVTRSVEGSAPGLYGGNRKSASCDVEKQITALGADPAKNRAFAQVHRIEPSRVPDFLRSLTPVQLRMDTRVTNHGFKDGGPRAYQAVLQAGTAVLVDDRGVPRVRCACGNPLLPPVAQKDTPRAVGDAWPGYRPSNVVVVAPADKPVKDFVIRDGDKWIKRPAGDTGTHDKETEPPSREPSPSKDAAPSDGGRPPSEKPKAPPPPEPPSQESPPAPPPESEPPPEAPPSEPQEPPLEPAPESGADSPDGPAPDEPEQPEQPEEPAPQQPGGTSGLAPGPPDAARAPVVLGSVLI
ncbi:DUF6777 domain-containing protein [Streptomyces sp. V1I6]|uniref:DUF6777 domain-containing protein n=1 Tax=Streptomyces sp. V1I6 TaxID=3042273 RepID=UPI0027D8ACAF|nr:DUF6777 domain-containing protein [Streptomyces sp. V1I6]